jgi:hypothetical protein
MADRAPSAARVAWVVIGLLGPALKLARLAGASPGSKWLLMGAALGWLVLLVLLVLVLVLLVLLVLPPCRLMVWMPPPGPPCARSTASTWLSDMSTLTT